MSVLRLAFIGLLLSSAAIAETPDTQQTTLAEVAKEPSVTSLSIPELEARATNGEVEAITELGLRYGRGDGVPADAKRAVALLQQAAAKSDPAAQFFLGTAYANGAGVEKNAAKAEEWYEKAAHHGHAQAQYLVAIKLSGGVEGKDEGWAAAIPYLEKSADQEFPLSESMLGYAYHKGRGVAEDFEKAAYWYRRALSHGANPTTAINLRSLIELNGVAWQVGDPGENPATVVPTTVVTVDPATDPTFTPEAQAAAAMVPSPDGFASDYAREAAAKAVPVKPTKVKGVTFTAETGNNWITIYSASKKPVTCELIVRFLFTARGGREVGDSVCVKKEIGAGDHVEACDLRHEKMIDPELLGPVEATCD